MDGQAAADHLPGAPCSPVAVPRRVQSYPENSYNHVQTPARRR